MVSFLDPTGLGEKKLEFKEGQSPAHVYEVLCAKHQDITRAGYELCMLVIRSQEARADHQSTAQVYHGLFEGIFELQQVLCASDSGKSPILGILGK